jgi:hypothetical protein
MRDGIDRVPALAIGEYGENVLIWIATGCLFMLCGAIVVAERGWFVLVGIPLVVIGVLVFLWAALFSEWT